MHDYHADAADRIAVQNALDIISYFVRNGLPLVTWEIRPHVGKIHLDGHAGQLSGAGTPEQVRDIVNEFSEWFGVWPQLRRGDEQDSISATTEIDGVEVEVWGVVARHGEAAK